MKKIKISLVISLILSYLFLVACGAPKSDNTTASSDSKKTDTYKIGCTIQDLSNPIWAAKMDFLAKMCKEKGWELTSVDCSADSGKQITQIENFITSNMNVICVQPADPNSLSTVLEKAHKKGIVMIAEGITFPGADISHVNDNYNVGKMVGTATGEWLNKTYGKDAKSEVAIFEWPSIKECIERVEGMKDGLAAAAPKATVVASASAANVTDGMSNAENILQAQPNLKAFMCFGDGGAMGAFEVLQAKKADANKIGIFSIDGTDQALANIKNNTIFKMSVSLGSAKDLAQGSMDAINDIFAGNYKKVYLTPNIPVTIDNVEEFITK